MIFFVRRALFILGLISLFLIAPSAFAGDCEVGCVVEGISTPLFYNYEISTRASCEASCSDVCTRLPQLLERTFLGRITCRGTQFTPARGAGEGDQGAARTELESERPGSCTITCVDGSFRRMGRINSPNISTDAACANRCQQECTDRRSALNTPYRCEEYSFIPLPGTGASQESTGSSPEEGDEESTGGNANTQGARAARSRGTTGSGSAGSFHGVNDPFGGRSLSHILGNVIKFMLSAAGALFLAMFVYGGSMWLTAGSSDRHEQATKTLLNASAGVLIVIFSYTLVSGLVRLMGDLGVSQSNVGASLESEDPSGSSAATNPATATGDSSAASGQGTCNADRFVSACQERCTTGANGMALSATGMRDRCLSSCTTYGSTVCTAVHAPADCASGCHIMCENPEIPAGLLREICSSECPDLCAAAFR